MEEERKAEKGDEREKRGKVRVGWHFYWSLGIWCPTIGDIRAPFPPLLSSLLSFLTPKFRPSFPLLVVLAPVSPHLKLRTVHPRAAN